MILPPSGLEAWFDEQEGVDHEFPDGRSREYVARYRHLKEIFQTRYHAWVNAGAASFNGGLLTDHGPEHVNVVIKREGDLIRANDCVLTAYEVYLMLVATHLHDVGNIFGRERHEQESRKILSDLGPAAGFDTAETRQVQLIARAHGGFINGSKDTISSLQQSTMLLNQSIRPRLLAAVIRLADEYSDQANRAARFLLDNERLPKESEVFHKYASGLHSVRIRPQEERVELHFSFGEESFTKKFGRIRDSVYLLDEIFERTTKLFTETMYCNRFMRPNLEINSVSVFIEIIRIDDPDTAPKQIAYRLEESGYPTLPKSLLHNTNEALRTPDGKLDGASLARELRNRIKGLKR